MTGQPDLLCEIWRGPLAESCHFGHAVICDDTGQIVQAWGDPDTVALPRSSSKMIQALPLVTSGAANAYGLTDAQLALACASHDGAPLHVLAVNRWLADLGLEDAALRCGAHLPLGNRHGHVLVRAGVRPCQVHNNCSGKHAGFLTLAKHLGAGPEYTEPDHPVQRACFDAFDAAIGARSPFYGIDGCSAPNPASTIAEMARAMAWFATAQTRGDVASRAAARITEAMYRYPALVAGDGRACTELMRIAREPVTLKTGAEGYYIAILPNRGLGVALKIVDGAMRAAECAIAAILVRLGVLDADHPSTKRYMNAPIKNFAGRTTGEIRPGAALLA
ncbi:MAG: asparaginase [Paracoccaceae bacterium]